MSWLVVGVDKHTPVARTRSFLQGNKTATTTLWYSYILSMLREAYGTGYALSFEHVLNLGEHITSSEKPFHMPQFWPAAAWLSISWITNQPNSITFKRKLNDWHVYWLTLEHDMLASDHFVSFVYLSFIKFVQSSLLRSQAFTKPCHIQPWTWRVWTLNELGSLPSWNLQKQSIDGWFQSEYT